MSRSPLKNDRPASYAVLCGMGSVVAISVAIISLLVPTGYEGRSDPFYWLLMAPSVIWILSAINFRRWAMYVLPFILLGVPAVALILLLITPASKHADVVTLWIAVMVGVTLGGLGWRCLLRSGLSSRS